MIVSSGVRKSVTNFLLNLPFSFNFCFFFGCLIRKMSKVLITYKRRRVLKKTNPCADTNDDSSCKTEGEASASKHLAPTAEETAEKDILNEEKVVRTRKTRICLWCSTCLFSN